MKSLVYLVTNEIKWIKILKIYLIRYLKINLLSKLTWRKLTKWVDKKKVNAYIKNLM